LILELADSNNQDLLFVSTIAALRHRPSIIGG